MPVQMPGTFQDAGFQDAGRFASLSERSFLPSGGSMAPPNLGCQPWPGFFIPLPKRL